MNYTKPMLGTVVSPEGKLQCPAWKGISSTKGMSNCKRKLMRDHAQMCIEIPPKHAVSSVIGFIKDSSALAIAQRFGREQQNFSGENFWAMRLYCFGSWI